MSWELPKKKGIFPPEGGWKESTMYLVRVSCSKHNPIHHSMFFSGFIDSRGNPNGYNSVWCPTGDAPSPISSYYFLEVVKEIPEYKVGL